MTKGYTMILKFVCERGFPLTGIPRNQDQEWYAGSLPSVYLHLRTLVVNEKKEYVLWDTHKINEKLNETWKPQLLALFAKG